MDNLLLLQQFHLIRPYWLLSILPLLLVIWLYKKTHTHSKNWASVIDKRLLPHLLQGSHLNTKKTSSVGLFILGFIFIFALAGPAFEKRPQPVFKTQSALVIILDLSRSMDATDTKPSRLSRAHFKINDILKQRKEGQTALIAYAANAYVVSPLTDDADTIASQVSALETYIMPAQGSRLDKALDKALELFNNAGHSKGDVLVITDSINSKDESTLNSLQQNNIKTSILAIGTTDGAPIADHNGGFVKDKYGSIVVPKLDITSLRNAALSAGGKFSLLTSNDTDINHLLSAINIDREKPDNEQTDTEGNKFKTDTWHEEGPWLILLLIPFAAYAFRKGLIFLLVIFILPIPQPAHALEWSDLWKNNNQQGQSAIQKGNNELAAELFNHPEWKSAAQYKAGNYQESANLLDGINTADANYNRGNALAKAGNTTDAIKAYNSSLEINPKHEDALFNKELLEKNKEQEQQKNNDQEDEENKDNSDKSDSNSESGEADDSTESQSENQDSAQGENNKSEKPENNQSSDKTDQDTEEPTAKEQTEKTSEKNKEKEPAPSQDNTEESPDLEKQQTQQWLKKIPDDPGGLLRRKFKYQYSREQNTNENTPW